MSETKTSRQVAMGPFGGYYRGDRIAICDKYGCAKATVMGWSQVSDRYVRVEFDVEVFGNREGIISLKDLAHRAYAEVVLPDSAKES